LWPVTELTARMVGAWLAAIGVTLVAVLLQRDSTQVRAAMLYLAAVAAAQLRNARSLSRHGAVGRRRDAGCVAVFAALLMLALHGLRTRRGRTRSEQPGRAPAIRHRTG
jgi:hypothetical protein